MSTHNIGLYEDLTKIIFELSSNIVKYAPFFFCCLMMKNFDSFLIFCSKHRLWVLVGITSFRRVPQRGPTIYVLKQK